MSQQVELRGRPAASQPTASRQSWFAQHKVAVDLAVFVGQRLLQGAVVLAAIAYLTFLGLDMARGVELGEAARLAAQETVAYFSAVVRGDLGLTLAGSVTPRAEPVSNVLGDIVSKSLGLLGLSLLIAAVTGVAMGMIAARRRHGNSSLAIIMLSIIGVSVPSFFAAMLLQLLMVKWSQRFGSPLLPIGGFGWDKHIILPALVLAARPVAQITRVTFVTVGGILGADFVRTAISKGLWQRQVWSHHILRNVAIPILTTIGLSLRFSLSSLPVVEYFFGWPGMGFTLLKSISRQDDNLTVALILVLGLLFILVNLVLELAYRFIDPRLRETAVHVDRSAHYAGLAARVRGWMQGLVDLIRYNPIRNWLDSRRAGPTPNPFRNVLDTQGTQFDIDDRAYAAERRKAWLRGTAGNVPFVLGAFIVVGLLVLVFLGPRLSPQNPYATQGLTITNGEFRVPPFAPDAVNPWGTDVLGRDIMSLVFTGAQQTLILATLAVLARLLVGFVLGAIAGWRSGGLFDRLVVGASEVTAAYPALILAMIVILALGIRQGMRPFVIALCLVGWGEVMQFVRGEVMGVRPKPFIESAVAVGVRTPRMIMSQVLPILLASLISIAALEMGAVLMLLGELGFVGIFIGGGAFAELQVGASLYHYSDVPEWGSLLSGVRLYARSYPWVAIFPATAFFVAIVGFNLFGEGLRRMVETVGVGFGRIFNRYTAALAVVALLAFGWARSNTGSMAFYRQQAAQFSGQQALAQVQQLADPARENRSLGTQGMADTADWLAQQFEAMGLQPAGQDLTYFQNRSRSYLALNAAPTLEVGAGTEPLTYREDFAEFAGPYRTLGEAEGPVKVVLANDLRSGNYLSPYPVLEKAVERDDLVMVLSSQEASYLQQMAVAGLLVVADDPLDLQRNHTLSSRNPLAQTFGAVNRRVLEVPRLLISEETANKILAPVGQTVETLREETPRLGENGVGIVQTDVSVSMEVTGTVQERVPASHVLGYIPGAAGRAQRSGTGISGQNALPGAAGGVDSGGQLDNQVVVVLAQYDSPPSAPDGCCPAANNSASGVAVMLEAIRTLQESDYQPYRTLVFVAYSGEGLDGGEPVRPEDVSKFLQAKTGFSSLNVEAVVLLRGLGAGDGDELVISAGGNQRLAQVFERAARQAGVRPQRAEEAVDISIVFTDRSLRQGGGQEAPDVGLSWAGWETTARTPQDTPEAISADKLEKAGRTLAQALMVIGRENRY